MTRSTSTFRRTGVTIALAGAAIFGSVALAPAASATPLAVDGESYTVKGNGNGGPEHFLVTEEGRKPIFFCEDDKKKQNNCQDDPETAADRF